MERKKLKLSGTKCNKMHLGKTTTNCPSLKVHSDNMNTSNQEKYLGDILTNDGKLNKTIEERKAKGFGLSSQIIAILSEVPLGTYKVQIGLHLRQAMLLNGMLFKSEAWHCLNDSQIKQLELVDIRKICKAQILKHQEPFCIWKLEPCQLSSLFQAAV